MSPTRRAGAVTGRAPRTVEWRTVALFLVVAGGLAWLVALPLWFGSGLASPLFPVVSVAMMVTPALAALLVVLALERPARPLEALGLWPLPPVRRLLLFLALAVVVPVALVLVALPVGAAFGAYPADLDGLSGFREVLTASGVTELPLPLGLVVALQLAALPVGALLNLLPALGEELGWRGWLLPRLLPLGPVPAVLVSGVVWGLWHAPVVLLGYNYPTAPGRLGLTTMSGMCVLVGAVFGWLRLRSGSVWPAALAHGAFNASAGTYLLFSEAGAVVDTTRATILGWTGWLAPLALVTVLLATGRLRPAGQTTAPHD